MRRLITTTSLIATMAFLAFGSAAIAQSGKKTPGSSPSSSSSSSSSSDIPATVPEAPIGHRQPRADQVPNEKNLGNPNDPINKEDAALDKKIKSICRGC
jgi:hypothetical protein